MEVFETRQNRIFLKKLNCSVVLIQAHEEEKEGNIYGYIFTEVQPSTIETVQLHKIMLHNPNNIGNTRYDNVAFRLSQQLL